jgi:rubredoxin
MKKYKCRVCGHIYDPNEGDKKGNIKPGTPFEDVPNNWKCPVCGVGKGEYEPL